MTEGLRVNFSDKEASSEAREIEPLPRGSYHVKITDVETAEVSNTKKGNQGKPYWNLEFTVQEGKYTDRKLWTSCMLFEGALYTLSQLMKSLGFDVDAGEFVLPSPEDLISRDVVVVVTIQGERKVVDDNGEEKTYAPRNDVKGIKAYTDDFKAPAGAGSTKTAAAGGKSNLLP